MRVSSLSSHRHGLVQATPLLPLLALLLGSLLTTGCAVRASGGGRPAAVRAASPASRPPPPRPEGFDEVRDAAPSERVAIDPQAAFMLRGSSAQARELTDRSTPTGLTTIALLDTARAEARGFRPEGGLREVILREGERATVGFDLAVGECLTVLAHGGLGVREVDAFVIAGSAPDGDILAQDGSGGPVAIVGGQAGCTRTLRPQRVEVVVLVRKGKGTVVAAVYRGKAQP